MVSRLLFRLQVLLLKGVRAWDRVRLRMLMVRHPGLDIHPGASTNLAVARFDLAPGAKLSIGDGVVAERIRDGVRFSVAANAEVKIENDVWLRSELGPLFLRAFESGYLRVGRASQLNSCMLSAKVEVDVGENVLLGMGSRVFDSDQHPVDSEHPEVSLPVRIEDHVWIAADSTILRGATIGRESVVGTRSLVRGIVEPHTVVTGNPARLYSKVGDRASLAR
ncbi:MAG: acyltransferase [Myxococcota bacterium]|jgi:hypothetical protein|nr:acyltransferase [Myxococcota bacterium]